MHAVDKTGGLHEKAHWLSSLYKGTLFNLLHTLNHGSSKETCPYSCGHDSLKCSSTAVSTASQHRGRGWRLLVMNESIPHRDMSTQRALQTKHRPSGVHKGLFSTIKGVTLLFQHFEMLILFSTAFSSCFQHEIPRGVNKKRSNKNNKRLNI